MRALAFLPLLFLTIACEDAAPDAAGSVDCLTVFPGLRVNTQCGADLRVTLNGRDIDPTPRRIDLPGAVILPWPDWAAEGQPAIARAGNAQASFTVHPYLCEVVTVECTPRPDAPVDAPTGM